MIAAVTEPDLSDAAKDAAPMTPTEYGVGARFTLAVYDSDYVSTILGALAKADARGLTIETNDISTYVAGSEQRIVEFLAEVISAAATSGVHISASILLSRGCPGELTCALPDGVAALASEPVSLAPTGQRARAHWSLYPLLDADSAPVSGRDGELAPDHMDAIYAAIELAKRDGLYDGADHFATRLDGDLGRILASVANAWIAVGRTVQHVTTHLTISLNSPTLAASE